MGIITESALFIVTPYLSRVSNSIPYVVGQKYRLIDRSKNIRIAKTIAATRAKDTMRRI
jgi:hypothetical protein